MTRRVYLWALLLVVLSFAAVRAAAQYRRENFFLVLFGGALICGAFGLIWLVVFERFLLPVRDGMRDAERADRVRRGRCTQCGYDLRASPNVCPECGNRRDGGE